MGYYCRNYLHAYQPRTMLTASVYGTLGCVYPIALGAKVGAPERPVVAVCGDGGFAYNIQELATAKQHSIGAIAIVFNDNAFGNVRRCCSALHNSFTAASERGFSWQVLRAQEEEFDNRVMGTKLHNPDFVALAKSFGVRGVLAEDAAALELAVREAVEEGERGNPTLIEVPVGPLERRY